MEKPLEIIVGAALFLTLAGCATSQRTLPVNQPIAEGTNRSFSHTVTTKADPDAVWRLWTDVSTWKRWDKGLKDAELAGEMALGSKGRIIPLSGPSSKFTVTGFEPKTSYTFETGLPLAKLTIIRTIVGQNPTRFRHDVKFSGAMAGVWANRFGPGFRAVLPPTMEAIAREAESGGQGQ